MPILMNGMSWRINHAQLRYILKEVGMLEVQVSYRQARDIAGQLTL